MGGVVALSYFPINSVGTTDLFLEKNQGSVLPNNRLNVQYKTVKPHKEWNKSICNFSKEQSLGFLVIIPARKTSKTR